jgi:PASTA domain
MRYQVRRGLRVVLLVPLIAFLSAAGSATAGYAAPAAGPVTVTTSAFTYVPLLDNRDVFPRIPKQQQDAAVLWTVFTLKKGESRRVTDQLEVRIPSGHGSQVGNSIDCYPDYQPGSPIATAGSGTNVGSGVNDSGPYQWNASLLLVAPATGNYTCQLVTYAVDNDPSYVMEVLAPAPGQTTYGTWLEVSSGNEADAGTWSYGIEGGDFGIGCPPDDSTGTCPYIGGSGRPSAWDVSGDDCWQPGPTPFCWQADPDATTFDAVATFQITDCHLNGLSGVAGHSSSCPASVSGDGIFGMGGAEGDTWLDVDQLYPDGSVCHVNRAYSEEFTGGQVQLSESYYDSDAQHHLPLYYDLSAPVSQLCGGSRRFVVDVHIGWTAGNPVKLDGGNINVIDSGYARTTVVPDVIGRTQAQADDAIEANGLTTWPPPDWVTSTAPVGTVLAENSPAGTIEPSGSPVQLTLSLGQVTVPDVIGDRPAAAVQAIKNAGLTAHTLLPINDCADPGIVGTVQYQSPGGGAPAPPGSQVDIRVIACTR